LRYQTQEPAVSLSETAHAQSSPPSFRPRAISVELPPYGVVLGRFQPIHLGHVEFLQAARACCRRLVIGITNPDLAVLDDAAEDPGRGRAENNPFTYFERLHMVELTGQALGWSRDEYTVVPAPITRPSTLRQFLPAPGSTVCLVTIYDAWGERKREQLEALGYPTRVLWRRSMDERFTSGTRVRQSLAAGDRQWETQVPAAIVGVLAAWSARSGAVIGSAALR
jgi:cytidyltransferase-like protein